MNSVFPKWLIAAGILLAGVSGFAANPPKHGYAATVNPNATAAALAAMRDGGNAVDGAIAAALTLAVVDPHNSGVGGGLFMLIRTPNGEFIGIDGRETAPARATSDVYFRNGKPNPESIQHGPLAAGVPGHVAALYSAGKHARLPMEQHLKKAAALAERGFEPDSVLQSRLTNAAAMLRQFPATAAVFLNQSDHPLLRQPDLAKSLRALADEGPDWFYRGAFARATEQWMAANGGVMTAHDFASYEVKRRAPLKSTYRGFDVIGFPPPSSGGVHVAEILNILETFDLKAMGDGTSEFYHVIAEAMKLAFADRAFWLGDPKFTPVPRSLMDKNYARDLSRKIDWQRATPVRSHGQPPRAKDEVFERHTTHFSVVDSDGWWVGCTATINNSFGSLVVIPGTGILLNNEMDDFSLPGVPNSFGLVGSEANAVAPGKRPLSSMSPTILVRDGKPVLVVGAAGGPTIISQVVLAIVRVVDFGASPAEALRAPRIHHQWRPDLLRVEEAVGPAVRRELENRGHQLEVVKVIGTAQAAGVTSDGTLTGAHDPRVPGQGGGF